MDQIVKRKKKGRPSKADLARRADEAEQAVMTAPERDVRRSLRRRNARYTFDYDDFIDEEDKDEEEEDEGRREKKLKLLLKLQSKEGGAESPPSRTQRVPHAPAASASSSDYGGADRPSKKTDGDGDDRIDDHNEIDEDDEEARGKTEGSKGADSAPGTPSDPPEGLPLPDKKSLELILDKLQKKDTYGVFAEPVDPDELPDYHDVIEHPMDFATVRKKLGNGSYATLEQFESDVFLICINAMQYNAPDTIYHKQARAIQELAGKKFQGLRIAAERSDKELKSEEKTRSDSLAKKPIKKPMSRTAQEPVGSDFSSGATLATPGGFQNGSNATPLSGCESLCNLDGPAEGNTSLIDGVLDKTDDLSGKGLLSRFGRKSFMQDENRRATYNIYNQHVTRSESIFTTFDSETKQLVGPHADHSYARSLARFAATLGPVAWNVASKMIEQALPLGSKFGRGWVGEYEPLPTPILVLEKCSQNEPLFVKKLQSSSSARMDNQVLKISVSEQSGSIPTFERSSSSISTAATKPTVSPASSTHVSTEPLVGGLNLEVRPCISVSAGGRPVSHVSANYQQLSRKPRTIETDKKAIKQGQVELNDTPSSYKKSPTVAERQSFSRSDVPLSHSRNRNVLQPAPFKQPGTNGFVAGGLPNGKVLNNGLDRSKVVPSSTDVSSQMVKPGISLLHGQEQGLTDPVELMRMMAENAQKQQKAVNHAPVHISSTASSVHSPRRDDSNNAAAAAARAWMSVGAAGTKSGSAVENTSIHKSQISVDSLYNPIWEHQPQASRFRGEFPVPGMHFEPERATLPLQAFVSPPGRMGNEAQLQNRPMVFPHLMTADLSRFQVQSPRHGLNPGPQPRQKQESLPPDLNIGFQPSGSPGRQSSQQPDLALQL